MAKLNQINLRTVPVAIEINGEVVTLNVQRKPVTLDQWREFGRQQQAYRAEQSDDKEADLKTSPLIKQLIAMTAKLDIQDENGQEMAITAESLLTLDSRLLATIHEALLEDAGPDFKKPAAQ